MFQNLQPNFWLLDCISQMFACRSQNADACLTSHSWADKGAAMSLTVDVTSSQCHAAQAPALIDGSHTCSDMTMQSSCENAGSLDGDTRNILEHKFHTIQTCWVWCRQGCRNGPCSHWGRTMVPSCICCSARLCTPATPHLLPQASVLALRTQLKGHNRLPQAPGRQHRHARPILL